MKKFWILPLALLAFSCGSGVSEAELEAQMEAELDAIVDQALEEIEATVDSAVNEMEMRDADLCGRPSPAHQVEP